MRISGKSKSRAILRSFIFSILGILLTLSKVVTFHDFVNVHAHGHGQGMMYLEFKRVHMIPLISPYTEDFRRNPSKIGLKWWNLNTQVANLSFKILEGAKLIWADETRYAQELTQCFVIYLPEIIEYHDRISENNAWIKSLWNLLLVCWITFQTTQITRLMGPTWDPPGSCRPQVGPMLAPWTLLSGEFTVIINLSYRSHMYNIVTEGS